MKIAARVSNSGSDHGVEVSTDGRSQSLAITAKSGGRGSSVNGGELLMAALARCFCNDLYREAATRGLCVEGVEVEVESTFGGPGEPGRDIRYSVRVRSAEDKDRIAELIGATDRVAEIHNTLRGGCEVRLHEPK